MAKYFDEKKWGEAITHPDWYIRLAEDYKKLTKQAQESDKDVKDEIKKELYGFFEKHLTQGDIALGEEGENWDKERKTIDTIVIHHTSQKLGITWQQLSAIQLIRLYAPYYTAPYLEEDKHVRGKPIYSHHFRNGTQVFYAYHWLVRVNGSVERLLHDNEIGWHAGKWEVNCRSVAICLDNDFENSSPPQAVLDAVAKIIKENYPQVKTINIVGHCEVNQKTTCPGNKFLSDWKQKLLKLL